MCLLVNGNRLLLPKEQGPSVKFEKLFESIAVKQEP